MARTDVVKMTVAEIANRIVLVRGHKVLLDSDLATLYQVETKSLNLAVRRNAARFPSDFMFQLTDVELENLRFQNETSSFHGGRRYRPFVFTEQGVALLSSVLRSQQAVLANIEIMRTFVRMRAVLASNAELARKLESLEKNCDAKFKVVFDAIRSLMAPPEGKRRGIGFTAKIDY